MAELDKKYESELWDEVRAYWYDSEDTMIDNLLGVNDFGGIYARLKELYPEVTEEAIAEIVFDELSYEDYIKQHPEGILEDRPSDYIDDTGILITDDYYKKLSSACNNSRNYILTPGRKNVSAYIYDMNKRDNRPIAKITDNDFEFRLFLNKDLGITKVSEFLDMLKKDSKDEYLEAYSAWDSDEGKKKRISDYRAFAEVSDDFKITPDNIDEYALNKACFLNYDYPRDKLIQELIN